MADMVQNSFYLILSTPRYSWALKARLSSKQPKLESGEVAMRLTVNVPKALFAKPQLQATVTVPESAVSAPVIDAQVLDNVREMLEQQTGMKVDVAVVEPTKVVETEVDGQA